MSLFHSFYQLFSYAKYYEMKNGLATKSAIEHAQEGELAESR